jgi:type I restriction enzyme S subunit
MGDSWKSFKLGDVCECITDGAHQSPKSVSDGYPMASVKDLTFWGLKLDTARRISKADYEILVGQGCQPRANDVLIAKDGNSALDTVCVLKEDVAAVLLSSVAILRPRRNAIDPTYLYLYFRNPQTIDYLKTNFISGAAIPRVVLRDFKKAQILLPSLDEQHTIASILGALDDKIDINRRMNETLEAIARAIFKDWFVDFGPTRAKMEGRAPYLAPEIWALFPDKLDDNDTPQSWPILRWNEVATLEYGKSLRDYQSAAGQHPVYGTNGSIGWCDRVLCNRPGTIIGRKGAYRGVHFSDRPFFVIDTAFYLDLDERYSARWAYYSISMIDINAMDSGSAIPSTSREDFYNLTTTVPPASIQSKFDELLSPLWLRQGQNQAENQTLAATRDLLLPKLMSGEIRVKDAEKIAEAAL